MGHRLIKTRVKVYLDVEIADVDYENEPSILHLTHPKLDGILELYLDKGEVPEDRLERIECYDGEEEPEEEYGAKYDPFKRNPSVIHLGSSSSSSSSSSSGSSVSRVSGSPDSLDDRLVKLAGLAGKLRGQFKGFKK
jgi:hypothetical protein